ncbi:YkvA family protein [Actinosynnema sp. NPDC020468]|uniref:YkvA family protein n=1 Tax=Actinosynnema sp. NPDC020468 TaxID=3154488 RepID=UPI003405A559
MVVIGAVLAALGLSVLLWRDADLLGTSPVLLGTVLLVVGLGAIAFSVVRRRRVIARKRAAGEPVPEGSVLDRAKALPRLLRDHKANGLPTSRLALWGFAVVYLISPIDILPELLPVIGVTDDAGVAVWLLTSVSTATGLLISRERSEQKQRQA